MPLIYHHFVSENLPWLSTFYEGIRFDKCDTIKGNESLVENLNFFFLTSLSQNFEMLHFDANPIIIGYLVTEL